MALTVCVKHLTGLPGIHDRQVRLCFRGETCMDGLSLFKIVEFYTLHSLDLQLLPGFYFFIFYFSVDVRGELDSAARIREADDFVYV